MGVSATDVNTSQGTVVSTNLHSDHGGTGETVDLGGESPQSSSLNAIIASGGSKLKVLSAAYR